MDNKYPSLDRRQDRIFLSTWPGAKPTRIPADLRPDQGCGHPGCLHHVSHPCEVCGRIAGRYQEIPVSEATKVTYTIQLQDGAFWATVQDHSVVPPRPITFEDADGAADAAREAREEGRNARVVKTTVSVEIIEIS